MGDVSRSVRVFEEGGCYLLIQSSESEPLQCKCTVEHGLRSVREFRYIAVTACFLPLKKTYFQCCFLLLLEFTARWYLECDLGPLPGMLGPHKIHPVRTGVNYEPSKGPRIKHQTVGSVCMLGK